MATWQVILLRSAGLFLLVIFFIRVLGKKHPTSMTPFHFVNYVVIAVITALIATNIVTDFVLGITTLLLWLLLPLVLDYLALRSKMVHDVVTGKETIIIKQGKIMEENLKSVRMTGEELLRDLRSKNIFSVADVEFALLESNGELNVLLIG